MITKKELVLAAMDNKPTERVPVGFWFHFLADEIGTNAFRQPVYTEQLLAGEVEYIERAKPDFVKIMTDGFFHMKMKRSVIFTVPLISATSDRWPMMIRGLRSRSHMPVG